MAVTESDRWAAQEEKGADKEIVSDEETRRSDSQIDTEMHSNGVLPPQQGGGDAEKQPAITNTRPKVQPPPKSVATY